MSSKKERARERIVKQKAHEQRMKQAQLDKMLREIDSETLFKNKKKSELDTVRKLKEEHEERTERKRAELSAEIEKMRSVVKDANRGSFLQATVRETKQYPSKLDWVPGSTGTKEPIVYKDPEMIEREEAARVISEKRKECVAPAYNKGNYQYIYSIEDAKHIGR